MDEGRLFVYGVKVESFPIFESLWYFAGVVTYRIGVVLIRYRQMQFFVQTLTVQMVKLLGSVSEDVAFAKTIKYKMLDEAKVLESEIEKIKEIDRRTLHNWKKSTISKMIALYPRKYLPELSFYDWDGAMKVLTDIYKNESKYDEKQ